MCIPFQFLYMYSYTHIEVRKQYEKKETKIELPLFVIKISTNIQKLIKIYT